MPTKLEIAQSLITQQANGAKLSFAERNIINIVKRQNRLKPITATIIIEPLVNLTRGLIKSLLTGKYQFWRGETLAKPLNYQSLKVSLKMPDGKFQTPNPGQLAKVLNGELKHGDTIKLIQ